MIQIGGWAFVFVIQIDGALGICFCVKSMEIVVQMQRFRLVVRCPFVFWKQWCKCIHAAVIRNGGALAVC